MKTVLDHPLTEDEAALWWLGQAGYIVRSGGLTVVIDPYLTDSAAGPTGDFARLFPPPLPPEELEADVIIITHDHGDHLDPETIARLDKTRTPSFIAPRHTARRLRELGAPNVHVVEAGDEWKQQALTVRGVFALPTGADVLDTTGYLLTFVNGRTVYHTSDTRASESYGCLQFQMWSWSPFLNMTANAMRRVKPGRSQNWPQVRKRR